MSNESTSLAIFPGTFDPVTHGHLDIIQRASSLYDRLIVAVGDNPLKDEVFTPSERREMIAEHVGDLKNVEVQTYSGLTVEFAGAVGARVILRGIRDTVDLHADYAFPIPRRPNLKAVVIVDVLNVLNNQEVFAVSQSSDFDPGVPNPDFLKAVAYNRPRVVRFGLKLQF